MTENEVTDRKFKKSIDPCTNPPVGPGNTPTTSIRPYIGLGENIVPVSQGSDVGSVNWHTGTIATAGSKCGSACDANHNCHGFAKCNDPKTCWLKDESYDVKSTKSQPGCQFFYRSGSSCTVHMRARTYSCSVI